MNLVSYGDVIEMSVACVIFERISFVHLDRMSHLWIMCNIRFRVSVVIASVFDRIWFYPVLPLNVGIQTYRSYIFFSVTWRFIKNVFEKWSFNAQRNTIICKLWLSAIFNRYCSRRVPKVVCGILKNWTRDLKFMFIIICN